jgi:hypothetical protein
MSEERKRVERVLPNRPEPKKRETKETPKVETKVKAKATPKPKVVVKVEPEVEEPIPEVKRTRAKPSDDKYIRFTQKEMNENHKNISERISNGELKRAHFAIDGDEFYFHFLIVKK